MAIKRPTAAILRLIAAETRRFHPQEPPQGGQRVVNLCGFEPQLIKLEFIIYLPKLKVQRGVIEDLMGLKTFWWVIEKYHPRLAEIADNWA